MRLIPDVEVDLNKEDYLNTKTYVKLLNNVIESEKDKSLTIALIGEWGAGKSSIITTLKDQLTSGKDKVYEFSIYDAWKYSNDSFRRTFIERLKVDFNIEDLDLNQFYKSRTKDLFITQGPSTLFLIVGIAIFVLAYLFTPLESVIHQSASLAAVISMLVLLITIVSKAIIDLKTSETIPYLFAAEQFEHYFDELLDKSCQETRKVVVIDNIDRCSKELAYELLTVSKTFLGKKKNVVFIIPFDESPFKNKIAGYDSKPAFDSQEFLRKVFTVVIRIKPLKKYDLFDFTRTLVDKYELGFNSTTIDIISKEYATNPRRVIQFCNNLSAELNKFDIYYNDDFSKINESLICKCLLIREEWSDAYNVLSKDLVKFFHPAFGAEEKDWPASLLNFHRQTMAVGKWDYVSLNKVLYLTDLTSKVSVDFLEQLETADFNSLPSFLEDTTIDYSNLSDHLVTALHQNFQRGLFETSGNVTLELIFKLNRIKSFPDHLHHKIKNEIETTNFRCLQFVSDYENICHYGNFLNEKGLPYLNDAIVKRLEAESHKKNSNEYFWLFFNQFSNYSATFFVKRLRTIIEQAYESDEVLIALKVLNERNLVLYFDSDFFSREVAFFREKGVVEWHSHKFRLILQRIPVTHDCMLDLVELASSTISQDSQAKFYARLIISDLLINATLITDIDEDTLVGLSKVVNQLFDALKNQDIAPHEELTETLAVLFQSVAMGLNIDFITCLKKIRSDSAILKQKVVRNILTYKVPDSELACIYLDVLMRSGYREFNEVWFTVITMLLTTKNGETYIVNDEKLEEIIVSLINVDRNVFAEQWQIFVIEMLQNNRSRHIVNRQLLPLFGKLSSNISSSLLVQLLEINHSDDIFVTACFENVGTQGDDSHVSVLLRFLRIKIREEGKKYSFAHLICYLDYARMDHLDELHDFINSVDFSPDELNRHTLVVNELKEKCDRAYPKRLIIHECLIGGEDDWVDIKSRVESQIVNNELILDVNKYMAGRIPRLKEKRSIKLRYSYNGHECIIVENEAGAIFLPYRK
jgi:hypothetical protein